MADEILKRDENSVVVLGAITDDANQEIRMVRVDPATNRILASTTGVGTGSVTSVSVTSANGFAGTVATATTTPAITISTSITGILKGNGTAISAVTIGSGLSFDGTTLSATGGGSGTVTSVSVTTANGVSGSVATATTTPAITLTLGAITPTSVNGLTISTTTGTLTLTNAKTLAVTNTLTFSGTDGTVMTFPSTSATIARTDASNTFTGTQTFNGTVALGTQSLTMTGSIATTGSRVTKGWFTDLEVTNAPTLSGVAIPSISSTNTLTNKRVTRRLITTNAPGATPTTNTDNVDIMNFTGLNAAITSMTTNLSGTPVDGDKIEFRFTDDGTARAITWGASFGATTVALPTTTVISTMLRVGFEFNGSIWQCIATC